MSDTPTPDRPVSNTPAPGGTVASARWLNEDWAATIVGLILLVLILVGVIPGWLVP